MYPLYAQFKKRVIFVNIDFSKEQREGDDTSCFNDTEGGIITNFLSRFCNKFGKLIDQENKNMIGVISPYKKQVFKLKNQILHRSKLDNQYKKLVEIETIDGFQGREKDIILFSSVRSQNTVGFLQDYRRMNVALTRARHLLVVFGKSETLNNDEKWKKMLEQISTFKSKADLIDKDSVKDDAYIDQMVDFITSDKEWHEHELK